MALCAPSALERAWELEADGSQFVRSGEPSSKPMPCKIALRRRCLRNHAWRGMSEVDSEQWMWRPACDVRSLQAKNDAEALLDLLDGRIWKATTALQEEGLV